MMLCSKKWALSLAVFGLAGSIIGSDPEASSQACNEESFQQWLDDATLKDLSDELRLLRDDLDDADPSDPDFLDSTRKMIESVQQRIGELSFQKWLEEDENRKRILDKLTQLKDELAASLGDKELTSSIHRKINMAHERLEELELLGHADVPAIGQERLEQEIIDLMNSLRAK